MMSRTQISMERELLTKAKRRAAEHGVSLAEYVRRLVADDLETSPRIGDITAVFDLADSGGSDVAEHKDRYVAEAVVAVHPQQTRRRRTRGE